WLPRIASSPSALVRYVTTICSPSNTPPSRQLREQVQLQGSLDGLDEYGTGGSIHYDPAHRTPSVDDPSRRLGLRLIPTASTSMLTVSIRDCVVEDKRKSCRWLDR